MRESLSPEARAVDVGAVLVKGAHRAHEVVLRGASFLVPSAPEGGSGPAILELKDQQFVATLLAALGKERSRRNLRDDLAAQREDDGALSLFQPVHRAFHPVVLEAFCKRAGLPRLDPASVDSAGLVVRRVNAGGGEERWASNNGQIRGWLPIRGDADVDPDPLRRPAPAHVPERIGRRLLELAGREDLTEATIPLFVAPPDVCKEAGATLFYGVLETASDQVSETPAAAPRFGQEAFETHLATLLKNTYDRTGYSWLGATLTPANVDGFGSDIRLLQTAAEQLSVELGAFQDGAGDEGTARALVALLNRITLPMPGGGSRGAGAFFADVADVLLAQTGSVVLPTRWPAIASSLREGIADFARRRLESRLAEVVPGEPRFGDTKARYRVRAFVRVKRGDGCPPDLVWSAPSEAFAIKPWFATGAGPPTRIELPDPTDQDALKGLKPSVAVSVPKGLQDLMHGVGLDDLLDGKKGQGTGLNVDWICGFNLPTITLCAFIVLSLFLKLFNILFFWLPFVKICIPIPRIDDP